MVRKITIGKYTCPGCGRMYDHIIVESFVDRSPIGSKDENNYQCITAKCPGCDCLLPISIKTIDNKKIATYNTHEGSPSSD